MATFQNREEAGKQLAQGLPHIKDLPPRVLAIPRGGVPVASAVCQALSLPLNVVPIRALALAFDPCNPFGCVSSSGELFINQALAGQLRVSTAEIAQISRQVTGHLTRDLAAWGIQPPADLAGQAVLIIDDGMHTGWTMASALAWARGCGALRCLAAVPISTARAVRFIESHCDQVIALQQATEPLYQIGWHYDEFPALSDAMLRQWLTLAST
jgi:putative phosphoribosyl transferase